MENKNEKTLKESNFGKKNKNDNTDLEKIFGKNEKTEEIFIKAKEEDLSEQKINLKKNHIELKDYDNDQYTVRIQTYITPKQNKKLEKIMKKYNFFNKAKLVRILIENLLEKEN